VAARLKVTPGHAEAVDAVLGPAGGTEVQLRVELAQQHAIGQRCA
jgi:hypothetical protein